MARETADGTPSQGEVERDFTVPADADLRPAHDESTDDGSADEQDGAGS